MNRLYNTLISNLNEDIFDANQKIMIMNIATEFANNKINSLSNSVDFKLNNLRETILQE